MSDNHTLSGAYAVDALDEAELSQFERHLGDCADCHDEVAELRETAALLSHAIAETPPAGLRSAILNEVATVRPLAPKIVPVSAPTPSARRPALRRWLVAAVAAVLLGIGVGVVVWSPWSEPAVTVSAADRVLQAPDAEQVTLTFADGSQATVTRSVSERRAVIQTVGMAPPPTGSVYQLWLQDANGAMVPAGVMPVVADQTVVLDGDASAATAVGVTIEPPGGSASPTSSPIAVFDLSGES